MIVVQTFGCAMVVMWIFRYDMYTPLKYEAVLGKGAQDTS
jgi:hypothetical protein